MKVCKIHRVCGYEPYHKKVVKELDKLDVHSKRVLNAVLEDGENRSQYLQKRIEVLYRENEKLVNGLIMTNVGWAIVLFALMIGGY